MLTLVALIAGAALLIGPAFAGEMAATFGSPWALLGVAFGLTVAGWLVGMLLVRTVGSFGMGLQIGGFVAAIVCLFTGQAAYALPCLANAAAGWVIQAGQSNRLGDDMARRAAPY